MKRCGRCGNVIGPNHEPECPNPLPVGLIPDDSETRAFVEAHAWDEGLRGPYDGHRGGPRALPDPDADGSGEM